MPFSLETLLVHMLVNEPEDQDAITQPAGLHSAAYFFSKVRKFQVPVLTFLCIDSEALELSCWHVFSQLLVSTVSGNLVAFNYATIQAYTGRVVCHHAGLLLPLAIFPAVSVMLLFTKLSSTLLIV